MVNTNLLPWKLLDKFSGNQVGFTLVDIPVGSRTIRIHGYVKGAGNVLLKFNDLTNIIPGPSANYSTKERDPSTSIPLVGGGDPISYATTPASRAYLCRSMKDETTKVDCLINFPVGGIKRGFSQFIIGSEKREIGFIWNDVAPITSIRLMCEQLQSLQYDLAFEALK